MKKLILTAIGGCMLAFAFAKAPVNKSALKGSVTDSVKHNALAFVTITLSDATTGKNEKSTLTKDNGTFELSGLQNKAYKLTASFVGYKPKMQNIVFNNDKPGDAINIMLTPSTNQLNEVSVTAPKPLVKQEIDRVSYDVQADPESKALTAMDMMRKLPLVSVDGDDNIQLAGSSGYKIFINGKPSALMASNPKDVLRSMPANTIQKIEVITTPPSKYDSEGLAGIINIITTKKPDDGYNGTLGSRYNYPWGPNVNFTGTMKSGKFGFSASGAIGRQTPVSLSSGNLRQTFGTAQNSDLSQLGTNNFGGNFRYITGELSYELDTLNLFTASINYNYGLFNQDNNRFSLFTSPTGPAQSYNMFNNGDFDWRGTDASLNYQLGFKRDKNQLLTLSYRYSYSANQQHNVIDFTQQLNFEQPNYNQFNNAGAKEHTLQLDYVHPVKKLNIEAGAKAILRDNFSDFESGDYNPTTGNYDMVASRTNAFSYHQDVYGAYNSYQLKLTSWTFKGGVRLENTRVDANFTSSSTKLNTSYTNVVPSVNIMRSFKKNIGLTLGYTDRIERPGIWQLNPFVDRSNIKFIRFGNPDLRPVVSHLFELNFTKSGKGSFSARLAYSYSNNTIENVSTLLADTLSQTTYYNVGHLRNVNFSSSFNYPVTPKLNVNFNGLVARINLTGAYNGLLYSNSGYRGNLNSNITYKLNTLWKFGINNSYNSPYIALQGKGNSFFWSSLSATRSLMKEKITVTGILNNPYQKMRTYRGYTQASDFYQSNFSTNYYRTFAVSFSYKFGKLSSTIKKNSRGINNDDVKSGGGNP